MIYNDDPTVQWRDPRLCRCLWLNHKLLWLGVSRRDPWGVHFQSRAHLGRPVWGGPIVSRPWALGCRCERSLLPLIRLIGDKVITVL